MLPAGFHPVICDWFHSRFEEPTEPQRQGWPSIAAGLHTLIAAPTGSGKTLAAFLACIDRLLKQSDGEALRELNGESTESPTRVVYVSPLRALSNDMHRNLETPLREIRELADAAGVFIPNIRVGLRTGDTTPSQRAALVRKPPHILVTTPESLYLMLTAPRARLTLQHVETVIVDEIHALVRDKRGSHLALSLERLEALTQQPLQRIGLSATQKPIERIAEFLVGDPPVESAIRSPQSAIPSCHIVDVGHSRELDLQIEVPPSELGAVCTHDQWAEVYEQLIGLIEEHRSTLIFVNTRRMAERLTHQLTERLGEGAVGSHHGSLSAAIRLKTERQLKSGELKAVVATASLELGIDVGYIDLVIQIGSPRSIATFLQRIGRSGHSLGLVPRGRLFALTRDELLESMALIRAVRAGRLDTIPIPQAPLDVLAQQIVAEVSSREWGSDELFELFRRAYPYRNLNREQFDRTVEFLSEGITRSTGRSRVYLHHDRVGRRLRSRKGSRIAAASNAGAIPEIGVYRVVVEPEHTVVGTVDEDFAVESLAGDVFLLGNTSWRIQHVRGGDVTVIDAQGAPPTIPFWRGEAPGRTLELSEEVSRLRKELDQRIGEVGHPKLETRNEDPLLSIPQGATAGLPSSAENKGVALHGWTSHPCHPENAEFDSIVQWLMTETRSSEYAARQAVEYAAAQKAAIGLLPTQKRVVFERFFDESGGMQMVIHAPFGSRITKAWGLAMRKRFCRSFDFELQATADDDGFILSLGPQHSFPLESMFPMLNENNIQPLLEQAVLAVPMFGLRWRWNVTRALLVLRMQNGKKVPPAFQRFRSEDLLTAVFPRLTGCQEEHTGDVEIPSHPLVDQTMDDCLHEALDLDELKRVLAEIDDGEIELIARDTREPSPFSYELLNANPYAFLDGGEIQERRARAVSGRRSLTVESVEDLGRLDPEAIRQVTLEAQPLIRNADELHDALLSRIVLPVQEATENVEFYDQLSEQRRATTVSLANGSAAWVAAERLPATSAAFPSAEPQPKISVPQGVQQEWSAIDARIAVIRGLIEISGPITADEIAERTSFTPEQCTAALDALEGEGVVLRGHFTPDNRTSWNDENEASSQADHSAIRNPQSAIEWCHRRLLARIHRLTLHGLRAQIQPVDVDVYMRFLFRHHGLVSAERRSGSNGLFEVISMLQGIDVPVVCWERDLLPARVAGYRPGLLDELCLTGEVGWGRLFPPRRDPDRSRPMASLTRVAPVSIFLRADLSWLSSRSPCVETDLLSSPAMQVYELIRQKGAMFASDLSAETQMPSAQLEGILGELVTRGLLTADGFGGLRGLIAEKSKPAHRHLRRSRRGLVRRRNPNTGTGRWSLWRSSQKEIEEGGRGSRRAEALADEASENLSSPVEQWAWQLLRRWGVVFRDLLNREAGAPSWFELLQVYRRLEARGEIRGGRFISGVAGEQFALGETVRKLRQLRDEEPNSELIFLSAADPLNLAGTLTDHLRTPATASNRIAYLNGTPVAALQSSEVSFLETVPEELKHVIHARLQIQPQSVSQILATPI